MIKQPLLSIPPANTIEELRKHILVALQKIVSSIPDPTDAGNQRVQNVANPTAPNDAVNKRTLESLISDLLGPDNKNQDYVRGAGNLTTVGAVTFVKSPGVLGIDKTNFVWDAVNHKLGIGTALPTYPLDVIGIASVSGAILGGATISATGNITTQGIYRVGADDGLTDTITPAASLTVNTAIDGVFGTPAAGQSNGVVVVGVTLNFGTSRQFSGGILIT